MDRYFKPLSFGSVALGILVFLFTAGLIVSKHGSSPKTQTFATTAQGTFITIHEAYALAEPIARMWQKDAKPQAIFSQDGILDEQGRSTVFRIWFASLAQQESGKGLEVLVRDGTVRDSYPVNLSQQGNDLPEKLLSEQEAIAKLRALSDYEKEPIEQTRLSYEDPPSKWLWVIRTPRGTVTFEAVP